MNTLIAYTLILFVTLIIVYVFLKIYSAYIRRPESYPSARFIQKLGQRAITQRIACLGDSITQGDVGVSYVGLVERYFSSQPVAFLNAGINSDLSSTLLRRLDEVIAAKPMLVTVLIGTNDVWASLNPQITFGLRFQGKIRETPTFEGYKDNIVKILRRLKTETAASIAILSLPLISEDIGHPVNRLGDQYSDYLREVAGQMDVEYLPLREKQKDYLRGRSRPAKYTYDDTFRPLMVGMACYLLGISWDKIADLNGNQLSVDNIHSNTCAAQMMAELVEDFIQRHSKLQPA